jgi:hypothetical protein
MKTSVKLGLILVLILMNCKASKIKKETRCKTTVATITGRAEIPNYSKWSWWDLIGNPAYINLTNATWTVYTFQVRGKEYTGEGGDYLIIGDKYIVKYDSTMVDNSHSHLVYHEPVFLENEPVKTTQGVIKKVFGKDELIGLSFEYCISFKKYQVDKYDNTVIIPNNTDSVNKCFTRSQFLPPYSNVDSIKQNMNKEYKVIYSPENLQRAILIYNNEDKVIYKGFN